MAFLTNKCLLLKLSLVHVHVFAESRVRQVRNIGTVYLYFSRKNPMDLFEKYDIQYKRSNHQNASDGKICASTTYLEAFS